ncbi:unnamed protein product [Prunus armeniaca]|uniref:Uncharacterized protein n=1 Tax=Prunus armeniaca TaxID=36596 RepID=A0A6J5UM90_PRUAR|nr:unnamed protein product [Prunus armeniaca]
MLRMCPHCTSSLASAKLPCYLTRWFAQDRSLKVTHNLTVFGGCGLVLSIILGLFGVNVDGLPVTKNVPYAFGVFSAFLVAIGAVLIAVGLLCLGLKKPIMEEQVEVRRLGLQELVKMFQHEVVSHALIRKKVYRKNLPHNGCVTCYDVDLEDRCSGLLKIPSDMFEGYVLFCTNITHTVENSSPAVAGFQTRPLYPHKSAKNLLDQT